MDSIRVANQVLPHFDSDMLQAKPFSMDGNGVVGLIAGCIRLVVSNDQLRIAAQLREQRPGESCIA